jgi:uncharacterized protein YpmS
MSETSAGSFDLKLFRSIFLILLGILTLGAVFVAMKKRSQKAEPWEGMS